VPGEEHGSAAAGPTAAAELNQHYFELYKMTVEMADRISARRGVANSFFLTVSTGIAALLGTKDMRWYVAVAGIVVAVSWWALLRSYRDLNTAKFEVILAMEERLPVKVYGEEWGRLKRERVTFALRRDALRSWVAQYRELGQVERIVPWIFAGIYAAELVRQAT
jgi:hypothetical protein